MLFIEDDSGLKLDIKDEFIIPCVNRATTMLLPHDFHSSEEHVCYEVFQKYERRFKRLKSDIESSDFIVFIFHIEQLNDFQRDCFKRSNITYPKQSLVSIYHGYSQFKAKYPLKNIRLMSLDKFLQQENL